MTNFAAALALLSSCYRQNLRTGVEVDDSFTLITTREIDAPVDRVWNAWHDPKKIAKWWGPAGFRSTVKVLDIRPGGRFEVIMHGPDGTDYPNLYIFDQVEEHKRLVYTNVGSEQFGLAPFQSVFDLEGSGNKTRVVLKARFISEEDKRKHVEDFMRSKALSNYSNDLKSKRDRMPNNRSRPLCRNR